MLISLANGTPTRDRLNPLDLPDDFFRIRVVCTLLDTCGVCFDRGSAKKKLDFFLTFFQVSQSAHAWGPASDLVKYYVHTKEPVPMDIDFIIQDTYALTRPQWKFAGSFEDAGRAFAEIVGQHYKAQEPEKTIEIEVLDDGISSSDDGDEDEPPVPEIEGQSSSEEADAEVLLVTKFACDRADQTNSPRRMVIRSMTRTLTKTLSSLARSRSMTRRPRLNLTESSQR